MNPNYAGYVQTPFGKWKIALAPVATGDEQGAVATLKLDPKALSLSGVWAFILKYWGLIEPYLAEYEPLIVMTIEKDLLSGVTDPIQIFKDLVTALLGTGADVSRLAQPGA